MGAALRVEKLKHYKCGKCGARYFDDAAMGMIQSAQAGGGAAPVSRVAESRVEYGKL